mmetsp:Transcript_14055/g.35366  ORF Transcript_14055/g.35366 Transcript_14055/m.35366 type:complete len:230 (-) Transcript_14055:41-730(-)
MSSALRDVVVRNASARCLAPPVPTRVQSMHSACSPRYLLEPSSKASCRSSSGGITTSWRTTALRTPKHSRAWTMLAVLRVHCLAKKVRVLRAPTCSLDALLGGEDAADASTSPCLTTPPARTSSRAVSHSLFWSVARRWRISWSLREWAPPPSAAEDSCAAIGSATASASCSVTGGGISGSMALGLAAASIPSSAAAGAPAEGHAEGSASLVRFIPPTREVPYRVQVTN